MKCVLGLDLGQCDAKQGISYFEWLLDPQVCNTGTHSNILPQSSAAPSDFGNINYSCSCYNNTIKYNPKIMVLNKTRSASNPMEKGACNSIYYQFYGWNSNMVSSVTMDIIASLITCNKNVQPFHRTSIFWLC